MKVVDIAQNNNLTPKALSSYVVDALGESLKQNFLGADINMEFLLLSLRVYLIRLNRVAKNYGGNLRTRVFPERGTAYQSTRDFIYPLFN